MKWKWYIPLSCLIVVHSPDRTELRLNANGITAVRAIQMSQEQHVAKGTKTIIYADGQKFGVIETPEVIEELIRECK